MDYVVTAGLRPPVDAPELDGLQQEGVTALLDRQLALVEGVAGPDDRDIDVLDYRITTRPDGASVLLALDAPSLAAAEEAAATVLAELLGDSELFTGWSVAESEVQITEDEFNQSLAAADGEGEELGDAESALEAAIDEVLEGSEKEPALDTEHWRAKLTELADQLRAWDPGESGASRLAAGALIHAVRVVTDEIFYDEMALAINNATVEDAVGMLVLEELPPFYQRQYDSLFARAFLLTSASVAQRLTRPEWTPPRCVAEALAIRLFINEARVLLEAAKLMSWQASAPLFEAFARHVFAERDPRHGELGGGDELRRGYDLDDLYELGDQPEADDGTADAGLHARGMALDQWFQLSPELPDGGHPYLRAW